MGYRSYSYDEYLRAMDIYKDGVKPAEISSSLNIKKRTIKAWIYEGKVPWLAKWHPEPSNELAYVIGVLHGDGCVKAYKTNYDIKLNTVDYKFAETSSNMPAKLLNKRIINPKWIGIQRGRNYG